jgi:hypothetical protein
MVAAPSATASATPASVFSANHTGSYMSGSGPMAPGS